MKIEADLHFRFWLEKDGNYLIGPGAIQLLHLIKTLGSLKKAAEHLNFPYRGAWQRVHEAETYLGIPLLLSSSERSKGLSLTPEAEEILRMYDELERSCTEFFRAKAAESPLLDVKVVGLKE